ncbi:polysaccharide deacetylase, partial [Streptomyces cinereoruber]
MFGLLGAALVGCGEGAVPKAASTPATGDTPSPRASTTAAARPKPGAEPAAAPTMAPGPNGLTPVYT